MSATAIKRLLLIVEDDPGDARLLREMFHGPDSHKTEVTHVERMSEAEAHLGEHAVDVILLDLGLPDAQGLEAVRRARAAAPHVPLVVLTGLDDESLALLALQEGAQDYLIKGQIESRGLARALRYAIERKNMEEARHASENELLQAQKLESIGRLAGGIAHDFNNMLFAIGGYAELLAQDLASTDPAHLDSERLLKSVEGISQATDRATSLTAQLLAFGRQQPVSVTVLDFNAAVASIEPMVRQLIGKDVRLVVNLDPGAGRVCADVGQIEQILVNLVVNARDAMPAGGTVTIETGNAAFHGAAAPGDASVEPGPYVFLAVTDTGIGMDVATRERMFEPFFTTKPVGKGTGLGLATTYGIVNRAGGHISVVSEPGRGSAIKMYFPREDEAAETPPAPPIAAPVGSGRVLVVDDEPAVRGVMTQFLQRAGFDVVAAADATGGLATAHLAAPIDVLVTDVVMPKVSGIVLADKLMDADPQIGVVLVSGYTSDSLDIDRVTARGARFLAKPITASRLLETVIEVVANRKAASKAPT